MSMTGTDLTALDDATLQQVAECRIFAASLMNGTRWAENHHAECDEIYDECKRRGRGIYQRAWNDAVRSQGHGGMVQEVDPSGV